MSLRYCVSCHKTSFHTITKPFCDECINEKLLKERNKQMNENYLMLNGKRVDLTDEQIEKLGLKVEQRDLFKRVKHSSNEKYYYIDDEGKPQVKTEVASWADDGRYNTANYCTDKSLMQQRALHETLSRLLWRFSMQNDGDKIDWNNFSQTKYCIYYNFKHNKFGTICDHIKQDCIHFHAQEIAQRAIDEIVLPFMKAHPDFVW